MNEYSKTLNLFLLLTLILYSCNAPKNNPLDPDNPDNKIFTIEGTVLSNSIPPTPISEVIVIWNNENIQSTTNSNGNFIIGCSNRIDGWIYFQKNGFSVDSTFISWESNKKIAIVAYLNSDPFLNSINFYSEIRNKYSQEEQYLVIEVEIIDEDNNIDSVFLECSYLGIKKELEKNNFSNFSGRFSNYSLSLSSLEEVIGRDFELKVKQDGDKYFTVGHTSIKRVIYQEIEFISPANQDSVSSNPVLSWRPFNPGFNFTFSAEVYTNEPEPMLMWKKENIPSTQVSVTVDDSLTVTQTNDMFYWVIWCTDEFNNKSRSKPASFIVKQ